MRCFQTHDNPDRGNPTTSFISKACGIIFGSYLDELRITDTGHILGQSNTQIR
jgi:hypothetical protein